MKNKIITKEEFSKLRENFRREKKTVVLCHGVFDLLHYGHIEHLEEAKAQGDILVVSVTAAAFVNKGPGRPYFGDEQRLKFLASIECVDYVMLSEAVTVHNIIECVRPDIYVKGQEYAAEENDVTGNIGPEREIVEEYGGKIYFTQGEVYSSTKLLNNFFGALPEAVLEESRRMRKKYGNNVADILRQNIDDFSKLRVLVVGDIIIDDYVFCKVQGLTMKDSVMSTRYDYKERYAGGALAIARHIANFAGEVMFCSLMGTEKEIADYISKTLPPVKWRISQDKRFITPVKCRYLKRHPLRGEYDKLFSVNKLLSPKSTAKVNYGNFRRNLEELLPHYDVVVVCDYGHGLLREEEIRLIEEKSKFLAVNCQANSSNYGLNVITKYRQADAFVLDERELNLAMGASSDSEKVLLKSLSESLKSKYAWLTLGAEGALGVTQTEEAKLSAVTLKVKDTVGAGDAFYALATLAAAGNLPIDTATLVANIAGAIKTNLVGNSKPVAKVDLLKFLSTVLNV